MKILSISIRLQGSGVSDYAGAFERELTKLGHDVDACDYRTGPGRLKTVQYDRVFIQFEIVHCTRTGEAIALHRLLTMLRRLGIKPVVVWHTILTESVLTKAPSILRPILRTYQTALLGYVSKRARIVTLNPAGLQKLRDIGVPALYFPIGVYSRGTVDGDSAFGELRQAGRFICAVVGHPYRFKRYHLAVRAFAALDEELRRNMVFAVVGGDASLDPTSWEDVLGALRDLGDEQVCVTGPLDDRQFWATLQDIDLALLPYEELPSGSSVVAQLAAASIPMIVSSSSAFSDLVASGSALSALDWPGDATRLMTEFLENGDLQQRIRTSLAHFQAKESLSSIAEAMVNV